MPHRLQRGWLAEPSQAADEAIGTFAADDGLGFGGRIAARERHQDSGLTALMLARVPDGADRHRAAEGAAAARLAPKRRFELQQDARRGTVFERRDRLRLR